MTGLTRDTMRLRDLASRYKELCSDPVQDERRDLWRRHNSLQPTRPLIYTRAYAWAEMPESVCACEDPLLRRYEGTLRNLLYWGSLNDDSVFEPWVTVPAVLQCTGWGVDGTRHRSGDARGSFKVDYPMQELQDIDRLRMPWHEVDEERTRSVGPLLPGAR